MLIGAAAQFGIFGAYMIALEMGFDPMQAGAIGIIGGADGPTAIFLSSKLAPNLMGAIAVSAYSLYGVGSGDTAAYHASAHHQERTCHPHETAACRFSHGEGDFPDHRFVADLFPGFLPVCLCWVCCSSVTC